MKRAGRLVADRDLAEHMKENGLGTPATRAETIEKLVRSEYLERKKKHLLPTSKGVALVDQVDTQLRDPVLTAQWEERLAYIEDGKANARDLGADVASWVAELVPSILRSIPMSEETKQEGLGPCPKCGPASSQDEEWGCSRYQEAAATSSSGAGRRQAHRAAARGSSEARPHVVELRLQERRLAQTPARPQPQFGVFGRPPGQDLGPCPACKEGRVRATPKGWGCSRYKEGCTLSIWREYHGKMLSEHVARELVEHGTTSKPVEGLVAKDGKKKFSAQLRFDERWRVVPVFEAKSAQADQPTPDALATPWASRDLITIFHRVRNPALRAADGDSTLAWALHPLQPCQKERENDRADSMSSRTGREPALKSRKPTKRGAGGLDEAGEPPRWSLDKPTVASSPAQVKPPRVLRQDSSRKRQGERSAEPRERPRPRSTRAPPGGDVARGRRVLAPWLASSSRPTFPRACGGPFTSGCDPAGGGRWMRRSRRTDIAPLLVAHFAGGLALGGVYASRTRVLVLDLDNLAGKRTKAQSVAEDVPLDADLGQRWRLAETLAPRGLWVRSSASGGLHRGRF
jgi:hypothetical protein